MEEKSLHIVIVGHVDHGKSTLIGRLFYDTGCLPPDKLEEIKRASSSMGKELEFAYTIDSLEEERHKGITIDIAHTFFKTVKRRYVIIDAPGHKEFLKNMISGASQAEAALLLVDITQGIKEQTRRHCYILNLIGIKQVAVIVNKMDMVEYSENSFNEIKRNIETVLEKLNIIPSYILPVSAKVGDNVARKSENLSWFSGPTVLDALDTFFTYTAEDKDLRFPVQDIYKVDGEVIAVGRVEAGYLRSGQELIVLPEGKSCRVKEIKKFMDKNICESPAGDCVGITFEGEDLSRGQLLVKGNYPVITDSIHANIFWMVDKDYRLGIPVTWRCATQEANGFIEKIHRRFDPASVEIVEKDATCIKPAEVAEVKIKLDRAVVVDRFSDIAEMGRFILEHEGHPVAAGIII